MKAKRNMWHVVACGALVTLATLPGSVAAGEPTRKDGDMQKAEAPLEQTKYLVLDVRIIDRVDNAKLTVGTVVKHPRNPLFAEDKPWEPRFDNLYANVLFDENDGLYKCWYSPFIKDGMVAETPREQYATVRYRSKDREMGICYAVSKDGLEWEKPDLGLVEFDGNAHNNLVIRGPHGAGIFKDARDPDPARRYKLFCKHYEKVMSVAFSPEGLHWAEPVGCPEIEVAGDTHNNALWVPELDAYVGITRMWGGEPRVRQVGRTVSKDFLKWTKGEVVLQGLEPHLQTYAMPVFRYAGVYLGLPVIFNTKTDRTHPELAWSPDTVHWHRIDPGTPLIPNAEERGAYDWGCVYPAAYPVFLDDAICLYYGGNNGQHTNWRDGFFCLATLRPDGFAGYEPENPNQPAVLITKPITCAGATLRISADVDKGGSIRVALPDLTGHPVAESEPITQTVTDAPVSWRGDSPLVKGGIVLLKFTLTAAKLYAFSFDD